MDISRGGAVKNEAVEPAIGGYFELELPLARSPFFYPGAIGFQSARAAFLALLRAGKPRRVWLPYYICGTMAASIAQTSSEVAYYKIDENLHLAEDVRLKKGEWLLYVDYFGIRRSYARSLLDRFDPESLIIDSSQALFSRPYDCLATIYSPRKFLGVPDGGLIVSSVPIDTPQLVDKGSFERAISLLKRMAFSPEEGYAEHQQAEMTLFDQQPMRMSCLTCKILSTVDSDAIHRTRNANFLYLHERLGQYNALSIDPAELNGPLCYPLLTENIGLREALIKRRVFVATYWQDVLKLVDDASIEKRLVQGIIPLPCDQRYGEMEMARIAEICLSLLSNPGGEVARMEGNSLPCSRKTGCDAAGPGRLRGTRKIDMAARTEWK